jgi:hypothetical protein
MPGTHINDRFKRKIQSVCFVFLIPNNLFVGILNDWHEIIEF